MLIPRTWQPRLAVALLGGLTFLLLLELGLRTVALGFVLQQASLQPPPGEGGRSLTVLCIGESTTAMGGEQSWL